MELKNWKKSLEPSGHNAEHAPSQEELQQLKEQSKSSALALAQEKEKVASLEQQLAMLQAENNRLATEKDNLDVKASLYQKLILNNIHVTYYYSQPVNFV